VNAARARRFDAIFMDGSMPVMDGFTATRLIREHEMAANSRPSRIVALTAQVRGADAEAWNEAGADQHMTKPFTAARLVEALKAAQPAAGLQPVATVAEEAAAEASEAQKPILDEEAIATMEAVTARSGRDLVAKVWKLFLAQAPLQADRIADLRAAAPLDTAALISNAHSLKSMCLSSGAALMAECCETIEHGAKAGKPEEALAAVADLPGLLAATTREMEDRLATRAPPVKQQA
jgi:two-component system sensor histidine kinase BarA